MSEIKLSKLPKNGLKLDLERKSRSWMFYCPLCAVSRRLSSSPQPGRPMHYVQVGLCSVVFTLATYSWFQWKGLVSFVPMWMVFEAVYRARVRGKLRCSECGFDPLLCLSDTGRARKEVEQHWQKKLAELEPETHAETEKNPQIPASETQLDR